MGKIINEEIYDIIVGLPIESAYRFKKNYWICEAANCDFIVRIKIDSGYVCGSFEDNEYDSMSNLKPFLLLSNKETGVMWVSRSYSFSEISEILNLKYSDNENIWDI